MGVVAAGVFLLQLEAFGGEPSPYIGRIDPPVPYGCKDLGGGLLDGPNNMASKRIDCGKTQIVWLKELVTRDPQIRWRVVDVLTVSSLKEGYQLHDVLDGCKYSDAPFAEVYVVGRWVWGEAPHPAYQGHVADITQAWMLNPQSKRIEKIPPGKVSCRVNEIRE